jgi:hypothetical protein
MSVKEENTQMQRLESKGNGSPDSHHKSGK